MTILGRVCWLLCIWIPPLICFEDFCSGNQVDPRKAWDEFDTAFKSKFRRKNTQEEEV